MEGFKVTYPTDSSSATGYKLTGQSSGGGSAQIIYHTAIQNERETTSKELTKEWRDSTDTLVDGSGPLKVRLEKSADNWSTPTVVATYTITKSGSSLTVVDSSNNTPSNVNAVIQADKTWTITVTNLEKYTAGSGTTAPAAYAYRFKEMDGDTEKQQGENIGTYEVRYGVSSGFAVPDAATTTQTITNKENLIDIVVQKKFYNGSSEITFTTQPSVKLRLGWYTTDSSNPTYGEAVTLTGTASAATAGDRETAAYEYTWIGKPRASNGSLLHYFVEEVETDGTTQLISGIVSLNDVLYNVTYGASDPSASAVGKALEAAGLQLEFQVNNTLVKPRLDVEKVDSANSSTKLSGAEFTLKRTKDSSGTDIPAEDASTNTWTATSAATTGLAQFAVDLVDGTYTLTETKAPLGYAMHSSPVTFTVSNGVLAVDSASAIPATGLSGNSPYYARSIVNNVVHFTLTITNTSGTELPSTGEIFGLSRMGFAGLGTVLLTAFIVLYQYKKRRQYYGEWKED